MMVGVVFLTEYYLWWILLAVLAYIYIMDQSVQKYTELLGKLLRINIIRFFFGLKLRIGLEWDTWKLKRSMKRFIKEKAKKDSQGA
jgi:uncharacterized membrane protein